MTEEILDQITHLRKRVAECTDDYLRIGFLRITGAEAVAALSIIDAQAEALREKDIEIEELKRRLRLDHENIEWFASELETKDEQLKVARADQARLDFMDDINARKNAFHGSRYGWGFSINHNRIALEDHHAPAKTIREAIDSQMVKAALETKQAPVASHPCTTNSVVSQNGGNMKDKPHDQR